MKQLFCVIYVFSKLLFQPQLLLLHSLHVFVHLFWRVNQMTKNRRRFVSKVGHLWYFMGLSHKVESPWRIAACSALTRPARTVSPERRQVSSRYGGALFFFHTVNLGTNAFCFENNILPSSDSFRSQFSTENIHRS